MNTYLVVVFKLQLHDAIYRLRFCSNLLIHILSLSNLHNNVSPLQKNRVDKSHRVIVALVIFLCNLFFLVQGASNVSPLQLSHRSTILNILNYHCRCIVTWHLLAANRKLVEKFQPSSEYSLQC